MRFSILVATCAVVLLPFSVAAAQQDTMAPNQPAMMECGAEHMAMMADMMGDMQNEMEMMATMPGLMDCTMMPGRM